MRKYIAVQVEPEIADFDYVFDDDGLRPAGGDFNHTLFIFQDGECRFNEDVYSDCHLRIEDLITDLDYFSYDDLDYSFKNRLDYLKEIGFNTDSNTVQLLDSCVRYAINGDYAEALVAYLEATTGKSWGITRVSGYVQGDVCTLVYCEDYYTSESINYYGKMWLGCGGEFYIDELTVPNVDADELDFSDFEDIKFYLDGDPVYGCFIIDDIIWRGGNKLISEVADCFDVPESELEVYVYEDGTYVNAKDM